MKKTITTANGTDITNSTYAVSGTLRFGITFNLSIHGTANAPTEQLKKRLLETADGAKFNLAEVSKGKDREGIPCTQVYFPLTILDDEEFYCKDSAAFEKLAAQIDELTVEQTDDTLADLAQTLDKKQIPYVRSVEAVAECIARIQLS